MVNRAAVEAWRFGASGGAGLGLLFSFGILWTGFYGMAPVTIPTWLFASGVTAVLGAAIGMAVAYVALVLGSMAADVVGRVVGTVVVASVAAGATQVVLIGTDYGTAPILFVAAITAYAAFVGWFRIPRILSR